MSTGAFAMIVIVTGPEKDSATRDIRRLRSGPLGLNGVNEIVE